MLTRWLMLAALVAACSSSTPTPAADSPPVQRAFYFWRTTLLLSAAEQQAVTDLHVDRLYVRMFDVEWNAAGNATELAGKITGHAPTIPITPVVFIRDEVFHHVDASRAPVLARELWAEITHRADALGFVPTEIQIDCDWTDTTRDAYFELLRQLHAVSKQPLSATIRLHQVKYRERTGVPPVGRGMLMFYNMGTFSADTDTRSIFDPASAQKYLARIADYPLPLDVALPIWSWVVHLRDDHVVGLLQSTDPAELADVEFLQRAGDDRYTVGRSAFLHGTMLREGDVLKIEVIGPRETLAAARMLAPVLAPVVAHGTPRTVSLFDLSERNLHRHGPATLAQVFGTIR